MEIKILGQIKGIAAGLFPRQPLPLNKYQSTFLSQTFLFLFATILSITISVSVLLEVKFPYDPVCPLVGWSVGRSVALSKFANRPGSNTSMLLSEHLLLLALNP